MRLRSDPNAIIILHASKNHIKNPETYYKKWKSICFENQNPLYLEIGAGKGDFIINKALSMPNINFIACEKYEAVLAQAAKKINTITKQTNNQINNLRLISNDAKNLLTFFAKGEIKQIFLNFSDPWPKKRHEKRRLTHKDFLKIYAVILANKGEIHLKTDNNIFFIHSLANFKANKWTIIFQTTELISITQFSKKYIHI